MKVFFIICILLVAILACTLYSKDRYTHDDPEDYDPYKMQLEQQETLMHVFGMNSGYLI